MIPRARNRIEYKFEFLIDAIIHNELYCLTKDTLQNGFAKIPEPLFLCKYMDEKGFVNPILALDKLELSFSKFVSRYLVKLRKSKSPEEKQQVKEEFTKHFLQMFLSISKTIAILQSKYAFLHRDLHKGNIMCNVEGDSYQWFLIDFGMTTLKINKKRINTLEVGIYRSIGENFETEAKGFKCHDIRLLFLSISEHLFGHTGFSDVLVDNVKNTILELYNRITLQFIQNKVGRANGITHNDPFWHRGYNEALMKVNNSIFEPNNFINFLTKHNTTKSYI